MLLKELAKQIHPASVVDKAPIRVFMMTGALVRDTKVVINIESAHTFNVGSYCDHRSFTMCVLRARGASFVVDEFLASSSLTPITVFRRGQPQWAQAPPGTPIPNESGFHAIASEADFSNLQAQITDAVYFLEQNQDELARLVAFPGVEKVSLDFAIEERDMAAQSERFPPNLLRIVGNLDIWLEFTLFPCPEPQT
ncbi:MAG TPA: hypothetical protein VGR94_06565 [Candidatus Acidoferrales bacterium]|nr:hypothetical protein [Candidatus Acidoferrales bacterium]